MTIKVPFLPKNRPLIDMRTGMPTREFRQWLDDIHRRTGTQVEDYVSAALDAAGSARATATALSAGVTVPAPGGSVQLTIGGSPVDASEVLSSQTQGSGLATIFVAGHSRTGAAADIVAGSIASVAEGATYYVIYSDPGNAGGAVTFEAVASSADIGTKRVIGAIYVPYTPTTSGIDEPDRGIITP